MIDSSAVARVLGISVEYAPLSSGAALYLPQRIALVGQGATASTYSATKRRVFSAGEVGSLYGYGSPLHLAALALYAEGVGTVPVTVYPLTDHGSGAAADGDLTPSGTATKITTLRLRIGGILSDAFTVAAGAVVAATVNAAMKTAIDAVLAMPVTAVVGTGDDAGKLLLTSKWKGASANAIKVEVLGELNGVTFAITQPADGATNPSVSTALAQVGNVWETCVINCLDVADTTNLDLYKTWGDARWGELVRKPPKVFTGGTFTSVANATAVSSTRRTDRINYLLNAPSSPTFPAAVASAEVAKLARQATNNPAHGYGSQPCVSIIPGPDGDQWDYSQRDAAVKLGCSTVEVRDEVVYMADTVSMYRPTGEEPPAYRHAVDVVKLENIIFNFDLVFSRPEWDSAPLIPDEEPTTNPTAKRPKDVKATANGITDALADAAIVVNRKAIKAATTATIDPSNSKRWTLVVPPQLSGNSDVKDVQIKFAFMAAA